MATLISVAIPEASASALVKEAAAIASLTIAGASASALASAALRSLMVFSRWFSRMFNLRISFYYR